MRYWRANWPNESIPPKIHFLEDHIVEFIKKWKVGLGFYGEQGKKIMIVNIFLLCRFVIIWCYSFYLKLPLLLGPLTIPDMCSSRSIQTKHHLK